jgi:GIY-YIG catalytic domain
MGVYALCDLDEVPIYVGKSTDGIRKRVRRHLTSARSDIIANRQVDVWEIAYVWAWPCVDQANIPPLEAFLFHQHDAKSPLMNGTIPADPGQLPFAAPEKERVQLLPSEEIGIRLDPSRRLPRQSQFYFQLVDHILNVKDNQQLRRSLRSHFDRLIRYHQRFIGNILEVPLEDDEDQS